MKSPPELWAEVSEVDALARYLGEFGDITITRAEPETTVAWEGNGARGTVELEPTGWGTKVTMTAQVPEPVEPEGERAVTESVEAAEPEPIEPEGEPVEPEGIGLEAVAPELVESETFEPEPEPRRRGRFPRWLFRGRRSEPMAAVEAPAADLPLEPESAHLESEPEPAREAAREPLGHAPEPIESPDEEFEFEFAVRRGSAAEQAAAEADAVPAAIGPERARELLETTLEKLGQAHHRPFSRG